jgi:hypothetical protein
MTADSATQPESESPVLATILHGVATRFATPDTDPARLWERGMVVFHALYVRALAADVAKTTPQEESK